MNPRCHTPTRGAPPGLIRALGLDWKFPPHSQLVGKTALCAHNWAKVTANRWVLVTISGHKLELTASPVQSHQPTTVPKQDTMGLMEEEVRSLLNKGAVMEVDNSDKGFYSTMFLVPKKDGQQRPVINLKSLNRFVNAPHFKMEGTHVVRDLIQQGDWLTRLNLKDAYFAIPVSTAHQKYLRFKCRKRSFQFRCLPFGLASAPRMFMKVLHLVVGLLRRMGIRCVVYLDDLLIMCQDKEEAVRQTWEAIDLLESLGFLVNYRKSVTSPVQELIFLGFVINSVTKTMRLPKEKTSQISVSYTHLTLPTKA